METTNNNNLCHTAEPVTTHPRPSIKTIHKVLFNRLPAALYLVLCSSAYVNAAPVVSGNTITVPDDGWYQIQRADDFTDICQGVRQCTVMDGEYIVINHSTEQRFESIIVGDPTDTLEPGSPLVVNGRISWTDNGWYQVQNQSNYESLCEGGSFCDVAPGRYIVINHTTNQRWENVNVDHSSVTNPPPRVANLRHLRYSHTAVELFWEHPPGIPLPQTYTVFRDGEEIGQTDGISFFDSTLTPQAGATYTVQLGVIPAHSASIEVPSDSTTTMPTINSANAEALIKQLASIINLRPVEDFFRDAQHDLNFQQTAFFISNTNDDIVFQQQVNLSTPYQFELGYLSGSFQDIARRNDYSCAMGGGVQYYGTGGSGSDTEFLDCAAGQHVWSGIAGIRQQTRGIPTHYPFRGFTATSNDGRSRQLSGGLTRGNSSFVILQGSSEWRALAYRDSNHQEDSLIIRDYYGQRTHFSNLGFQFDRETIPLSDGSVVTVQRNEVNIEWFADFEVTAPWTGHSPMTVSALLTFSDNIRLPVEPTDAEITGLDPAEPFHWQQVLVSVTAEDGSTLLIDGSQSGVETFTAQLGTGDLVGPLRWDSAFPIDCQPEIAPCY